MNLRLLIASLAAIASPLAGSAQETPEHSEAAAPIHWPAEPRPQLGATSFHIQFDGVAVPMILIQVEGISFELANRSTLQISPTKSARYSGELTDSRLSGVSMGISVFKKGEFLPDLSEESWAAYKESFAIDKPNVEIVLENSNIDQAITPYIFGEQFRQIAYQQETPRGTIKRREIFAFLGDTLLVFTVNGSKTSVDTHWTAVEHLIGEMSRS